MAAQSTGRIIGRVVHAESRSALKGATVRLIDFGHTVVTDSAGRFILVGVPPGERAVEVSLLGYRSQRSDDLLIRSGRATDVEVALVPEAVELEGVVAEVERVRLITPEIAATHEVVLGEDLRELPLDAVEEAVELVTGVTDGRFRGGRVGQEIYVLDGVELKNQFEASTQGLGFELPPSALEELEVITGGMGAQYGSALSGVVRYQTRRGDPGGWGGAVNLRTDHVAPEAAFTGFTALGGGVGGPVGLLGRGATVRADLLLQSMHDTDPRSRGLTCLQEGDGDAELDELLREVAASGFGGGEAPHCAFTPRRIPHQQGEKLLGFVRLDRPVGEAATLTGTLLWNRLQRQLYTPEFKYNPTYQLGQRTRGMLGTVALHWNRQRSRRGIHVATRMAAARLDRHLGALDPWTFDDRNTVFDFGLSDYRFLGEDFTHKPPEEQVAAGKPVPGYIEPGGSVGSPYGPAGEGLFSTAGTPEIANWSRTEFLNGEVEAELQTATGHQIRGGIAGRVFRIETYENVEAHDPSAVPILSSFDPATFQAFVEGSLAATDDFTVRVGFRTEGFRTGGAVPSLLQDSILGAGPDDWDVSFMPRVGVSGPIPNGWGTTVFRLNYAHVTQPPDFQYFVDTSIGDSLRTDIRRQGNPDLSFERGASWEFAVSHLLRDERFAVSVVGYRKELNNLVSGNLPIPGFPADQFTTGDFGTVQGIETSFRARLPGLHARLGYAAQWAEGVTSGALEDTLRLREGEGRREFPLAYDRRHAVDLALSLGRAAGQSESRWGVTIIGSAKSGFPIDLRPPQVAGELPVQSVDQVDRFPWTHQVDLRVTRDLGSLPGCAGCRWRAMADVRNVYARDNVIALRRDVRTLGPSVDQVEALAVGQGLREPIPRESERYSALLDRNGDGLIDEDEYSAARIPAALDRLDPSLYFGEAFQLRLGMEVTF